MSTNSTHTTLRGELESRTQEHYARCYQCGKCSAGCPAACSMDLLPHQLLRLIQRDARARVLNSKTIWMCASCHTCSTRCPQKLDLARTMDALRELAYAEGRVEAQSDTVVFSEEFLNWIRRTGRQFEGGLIAMYKLRTGHLFQDLGAAPKMMRKLKLFPRRIKGQKAIARIFEKCRQQQRPSPGPEHTPR